MDAITEMFGEVISSYSRAQAIEDGVLIDVSDTKAATLFKFPCAITSSLARALQRGAGSKPETFNARLWDVFYMSKYGASTPASDTFFTVKVGARNLKLWGNCGPGDEGEPVITVGFPEDR